MQKLLITCQCGQQMQAPRSALGKMGRCTTCGHTTKITAANTQPMGGNRRPSVFAPRRQAQPESWQQSAASTPDDGKIRFGQAVDHYYAGRYGEALALFDTLARQYPGNADIEHGRDQCMKAVRRPAPALPHLDGSTALRSSSPAEVVGVLDVETVRKIVLERLLHSTSETVQVQAAELAMRLLGIYGGGDSVNGRHAGQASPPAKDDLPPADELSDPFRGGFTPD